LFIKKCTEAGIIVALGHHNGSSEIINRLLRQVPHWPLTWGMAALT